MASYYHDKNAGFLGDMAAGAAKSFGSSVFQNIKGSMPTKWQDIAAKGEKYLRRGAAVAKFLGPVAGVAGLLAKDFGGTVKEEVMGKTFPKFKNDLTAPYVKQFQSKLDSTSQAAAGKTSEYGQKAVDWGKGLLKKHNLYSGGTP
jgi:hypothetical protein